MKNTNIATFINNVNVALKNISFEVLLYILHQYNKPIYLVSSKNVIERACVVYQHAIGETCLGFIEPQKHQIKNFVNYFENITAVSVQAIASKGYQKTSGFIDQNMLSKPIIPLKKERGFNICSTTTYGELIDVLRSFAYNEPDEVLRSGQFIVRGGAVDIMPYNTTKIIRTSFLDDGCSIYSVNKTLNQIQHTVKSFILLPKLTKEKKSLSNILPFGSVIYYNELEKKLSHPKANKTINFKSKSIDYHRFIKKYKSEAFETLPFEIDMGFEIKEGVFIPAWFNQKEGIKTRQNKHLTGKTKLILGGIYIHDDFGFCEYLGLEELAKQERVCLKFNDGVVKLDIYYLSKLSPFSPSRASNLQLSSLNRPGVWKQKQTKAFDEAKLFVKNLVISYAKRDKFPSKQYNVKDVLIRDFVRSFKYKDTEDQQTCWENIIADFSGTTPMNRLICGDVGFGKTELAIRAAFVSVVNNEQVIVLAPTTLLANQLYQCFSERVNSFGVKVDLLSRFSVAPKSIFKNYISKKTDILIGTSSVLFHLELLKNCGLFIVDEEHRFGVKDKELIFQHNPGVNFLSMSATPLPRTLELALKSIRNLSTIQTPPISRKPIISSVSFYNEQLIKDIVLKEVSRKGQVYIVDNSVDKLKSLFNNLSKLLPNIEFDLIYGSMQGVKLLKKMDDFIKGKTKVLLSTTIIESGIDIGLTNTIIINNAHLLGLSQLHQLRGRVGRSSYQAFAWFLVPKKTITDNAIRRLKAIIKHNILGVGYNISLEDLAIRGSGSLFGYKQSGVGGVGFDYYAKLLALAVKGLNINTELDCLVDLNNKPISQTFINDGNARAFYYKTIFSAISKADLKKIKEEIVLLYGFCSKEIDHLLMCREISLFAKNKHIKSIIKNNKTITISFSLDLIDGFVLKLIEYIKSFFDKKSITFQFIGSQKSLIFKFQHTDKNDYILLMSFINNLSFIK